jgi:HEAT repeat protein
LTLRFRHYLLLAGFFALATGGLVWFRQRGDSQVVSKETAENASLKSEKSVIHRETRPEKAWSAALQSDSVPRPTWKKVQEARFYTTPRGKANYLQLLEGYGFRGSEAVPYLRAILNDPDQEIRRAALRGLGRTETAEAELILATYARDGVAIEESTEAALVLGQMGSPAVTGRLQELLRQAQEPVLREHLVDGLAGRPWGQTQTFFLGHLRNPNVTVEEKQNALAMLGMRDTAPAEILTQALGSEREEIRAGAYQGLAWRNETAASQKIRISLLREKDAGVRSLGYEAWGNQIDASRGEILGEYRKEASPEVRLRALGAWARVYGRSPTADEPFLPEAISSLENVAMTDRDPGERKEALVGLEATRTKEGNDALQRIAEGNSDQRIRQLAHRLSLRRY